MSLGLKPTFSTLRVLVKYAVDREARLDIIEKMLNLNLIGVDQARQMEQLTPLGDASATNV